MTTYVRFCSSYDPSKMNILNKNIMQTYLPPVMLYVHEFIFLSVCTLYNEFNETVFLTATSYDAFGYRCSRKHIRGTN